MRARTRLAAAFGAAALAAPLVPGLAWAANGTPPAPPDYTSQACPPSRTPDAQFADTGSDPFAGEINCIAAYDISNGRGNNQYDPGLTVLRQQMALFLQNLLVDTRKGAAPGNAPCQFVDLANVPQAERDAICALGDAGIAQGQDSTHFNPGGRVTRAQMASFLVRTLSYAGLTINPPAGVDYFDDDAPPHEANINKLASVGVVQGHGGGRYGPGEGLPRDEMAAFLARTLELAIENGVAASRFPAGTGYTVTPTAAQSVAIGSTVSFTASGVPSGANVEIWLFACNNVNTSGSSPVFVDAGNRTAAQGTVSAVVKSVDTNTTNSSRVRVSVGSSGSFNFTVTDSAAECVRPVLFNNADGDDALNLDTSGHPTETVGIAGPVTFVNAGPAGAFQGTSVSSPTDSSFVQGGYTYFYDSGDTYQLYDSSSSSCAASTAADFKARLTTGDQVTGTYAPNGTSVLCLHDVAPAAPATVTAAPAASSVGGVKVTWTASTTSSVVKYAVYRAASTPPPASGSASYACPAYTPTPGASPQSPPTSPWTKLGEVAGTTYNDTTATPGSGAQPNQYCYVVSSIDSRGQVGTGRKASQNAQGGVQATAAPATTGAPTFKALQQKSQNTFAAVYDQQVTTGTCDAGDFAASYVASNGTNTPVGVVSAPCDNNGSYSAGLQGTVTNVGEVIVTLAQNIPSGTTVYLTSQVGSDSNTVCSAGGCQASGETVSTGAGTVAPAFVSAATDSTTTQITLHYNEWIDPSTVSKSDYTVTYQGTAQTVSIASADPGTSPTNTVVLTTADTIGVGGDQTVTVSVNPSTSTVCDPANTGNCQSASDSIDAKSPIITPQIRRITCSGTQCTLTYDETVYCPSGAAGDFSIGGNVAQACTPIDSQTGTPVSGQSGTVRVTFASTIGTGTFTYTKPSSPTTTNAVYHHGSDGTDYFAPTQSLTLA